MGEPTACTAFPDGAVPAGALEAAPDARARLVVSLVAHERLSTPEIVDLADRHVDLAAGTVKVGRRKVTLSAETRVALTGYLEGRHRPYGTDEGPLLRNYRRHGQGLSVTWLDELIYRWGLGIDRRRRPAVPSELAHLAVDYVAARVAAGTLRPVTAPGVRRSLLTFVEISGREHPERVTEADVEAFVGRPGLGASTRRKNLSELRMFWRWLDRQGRAAGDPTARHDKVREPRRLPRQLAPDDTGRLLDAVPDARGRLIVLLERRAGLRACEVARLRVEDVTRRDATLWIRGKGDHERRVPLAADVLTALDDYLAEHPATAGPLVRSYNHPDRPLSEPYLAQRVARWMRAAGIAESGHALRHTFAGELVRLVDIRTLQVVMGHTNVATTSRYLGHADLDALRAALDGHPATPNPDPAMLGALVDVVADLAAQVAELRGELQDRQLK